jgi:hypothetical protein
MAKTRIHHTKYAAYTACLQYGAEVLSFVGGMGVLLAALGYSVTNSFGHTALNIYWVSVPFLVYILYSTGKIILSRSIRFSIPLLVLGIYGGLLPVVWDVTNILEEHHRWCHEGMPNVPTYRVALMIAYGIAVLMTVGLFLYKEYRNGLHP